VGLLSALRHGQRRARRPAPGGDHLPERINAASVTINAKYTGASPTKTMTLSATMLYKPLIGFVPTPKNVAYAMTMMLELQ
jgi:hypothetical protein